jgi:hypothetical protein
MHLKKLPKCWPQRKLVNSGRGMKVNYILSTKLAILVSDSDLLKHWRATYFLDECSAILISGSDLLKHWRATHILN